MRKSNSLAVMLFASSMCLFSISANAEEEGSSKKQKTEAATPAPVSVLPRNGVMVAPNNLRNAPPSTPAPSPNTAPGKGERALGGVLDFLLDVASSEPPHTPPPPPSSGPTSLFIASDELERRGFLSYFDLGVGGSALHDSLIFDPSLAAQMAGGIRTKYLGLEISIISLRAWNTIWNDPKYVSTYTASDNTADTLTFFVTGYIPVNHDTDILLKFGRANLNITDYSIPNSPVSANGYNWVRGAGMEIRGSQEVFFRFETAFFGRMLQFRPDYYGLVLGAYIH